MSGNSFLQQQTHKNTFSTLFFYVKRFTRMLRARTRRRNKLCNHDVRASDALLFHQDCDLFLTFLDLRLTFAVCKTRPTELEDEPDTAFTHTRRPLGNTCHGIVFHKKKRFYHRTTRPTRGRRNRPVPVRVPRIIAAILPMVEPRGRRGTNAESGLRLERINLATAAAWLAIGLILRRTAARERALFATRLALTRVSVEVRLTIVNKQENKF